jgi:hypothetical protein
MHWMDLRYLDTMSEAEHLHKRQLRGSLKDTHNVIWPTWTKFLRSGLLRRYRVWMDMDLLEDCRYGKTWQSWNSGSSGPSLQVAMLLRDALRTYKYLGTCEILLPYLVNDNIHKNSPHLKHHDINTHQIYLERVSTLKCPNAEGRRCRSVYTTNQV